MSAAGTTEKSREQQLLDDLDSTKRTVRVAAIVQLSKTGNDPLALRKLQVISQGSDRELALFATQAIARIQTRLGDIKQTQFSGENLKREHFLAPLPEEIPQILAFIRANPAGLARELRPAAAEFLEKHGNEHDAGYLLEWLNSEQSVLALPYLDAILTVAPKTITPLLPALLASDQPILRVRAITFLRRVDQEEAYAHLSELLGSKKAEERLAGLSIGFIFPFEELRPLLLTLLRTETDTEVNQGIELFFEANPEVESALRLLDLLEGLPKEKSAAVKQIFLKICHVLEYAEILPPDQAKPEALIALWKKERLNKFLADLEVQITVCDPERLASIEAWLIKNLQNPDVAQFVEKLSTNTTTEDLYRRLTGKDGAGAVLTLDWNNPSAQLAPAKRKMIESLDSASFKKVDAWVREEAANGIPTIRAAALNALRRFSNDRKADLPLAEMALKSSDSGIAMAGIRFFEKADKNILQGFLPSLLQAKDISIRTKAIRLALSTDTPKALETIKSMLNSPEPSTRAHAASCLMLCPFDLVFDSLIDTLMKETNPDIAQKILFIIQSNPSTKTLGALDKIQKTKDPAIALLIAQTRTELFELVLKFGYDNFANAPAEPVAKAVTPEPAPKPTPGPAPEAGAKPKKEEPTPKTAPPPTSSPAPVKTAAGWAPAKPYAVSEVRNTIRQREAAARKQEVIKAEESNRRKIIGYGLAVCGAFLFFMIFTFWGKQSEDLPGEPGKSGAEKAESEGENGIPNAFRMNKMCRLKGKVEMVTPEGLAKVLLDQKTPQCGILWVKPQNAAFSLVPGEKAEIEVLPYRQLDPGEILAEGHKIASRP